LKLWGYSNGDSLRNRRNMAFLSAIFALLIWPHEIIFLHLHYDLDINLCKVLLIYIGTVASGTIGGYIWGAVKDQAVKMASQSGQKDKVCGD